MSTVYVQTVRCPTCGVKLKWTHEGIDDEPPECPKCGAAEAVPIPKLPLSQRKPRGAPAIVGVKSRVMDLVWDVASRDYGLTDLKDKIDIGETAAPKLTPKQAEMDAAWKAASGRGPETPLLPNPATSQSALIGMAQASNAAAKARGEKPFIESFHKAMKGAR